MSKKLTQEEFVSRSNTIHNNKYEYTNVVYVNGRVKVKIKCPEHGVFEQMPKTHLRGSGCKKCSLEELHKSLTHNKQTFIDQAIQIHQDRFSYNLVEYVNARTKVRIICKTCNNIFEQTPEVHLRGNGCPSKLCRKSAKDDTQSFVEKATKIHNGIYDYSLVQYVDSLKNVNIICNIHGVFSQKPNKHLQGQGCKKCGGYYQYDTTEFITKAKDIHGEKYDYGLVEYTKARSKIQIKCIIHNIVFELVAFKHLQGRGCPECSKSISKPEIEWLDALNIPTEYRGHKQNFRLSNGKLIKPDAYDPTIKTVYEFYGDYWHGNPDVYDHNNMNEIAKKTFGELYQNTIDRQTMIKEAGYKIVYIWENDWKQYD